MNTSSFLIKQQFFYIVFLGLFSFVMLVDYFPLNNNGGQRSGFSILIPITEVILHICMWSIVVEEIFEVGKNTH
jgi:hypothetical protein